MIHIPNEPDWLKTVRGIARVSWPGWLRKRMHPYPEQFSPALDLPTYDGPVRLYLMATTPRSGSHFLGHAIGSTGHFGFPLEYLNPRNLDLWSHRFGTRDVGQVFENLYRHRSGPTGLFGIKAHWNQYTQFSHHALFEYRNGFEKAVWLYRRDLLAQSVSRVVAQQTGQWIGGARRRGTLRFDYDAIIRNAQMIRHQNKKWGDYFATTFTAPYQKVVFEDIVSDAKTLNAIATFLSPDAPAGAPFTIRTRKQASDISRVWQSRFKIEIRPEHAWIVEPQAF